MSGIFSLLEAAAKFEAFSENLELAREAILAEWAVTVRDRAKEVIGTYKVKSWPQLADSTQRERERDGFPANEPLLLSGKLRDSIQATVEMHGPEDSFAIVGSNEDVALWQEVGTSHIPARSFLVSSAVKSEAKLNKIARKYVSAAWRAAKYDNEILELLHAIKLLLEAAHSIYHPVEELMK